MSPTRLDGPTDLDDGAALLAADTQGLLRAAASAGAQVRAVAAAHAEGELARLVGGSPRSVVLVPAGGAAGHAAALLQQLVVARAAVPVLTAPTTPRWVGALDVVVVLAEDAGDLELAGAVSLAAGRGADVVLVAPAEGPLAAAGRGRAVLLPPRVPGSGGTSMLRFLTAGLAVLGAVGAVPPPALDELADTLDVEAARDHPDVDVVVSPAKTWAARTAGRRPVLAGGGPLGTGLARHAATVLLRHAGVSAAAVDLADALVAARHGTPVGAVAVDPLFHDPELDGPLAQDPTRVFLLAVGSERDRLAPRSAALGEVDVLLGVADGSAPVVTDLAGTTAELVVLAARVETAAVYAGLAG